MRKAAPIVMEPRPMTLALARKYRPTQLADLVGQDVLKNTLTAAITHNRVAQAYVLTGIRGVGKTTTARVIARALNCVEGPTTTPCGVCASCQAMDADSAMDVIEIDAASKTGVDNMREMIANVAYAPMQAGARKIYIIDEAHMLSKAAWNALLKTLEEPPAHITFIFATTEPRAIPGTVLSRCQTLPLGRIPMESIEQRLHWVADQEGTTIAPAAARVIARAAEGSMRDALSLLDQAIATQPGGVQAEAVLAMIGRAGRMAVSTLVGLVVAGNIAGTVEMFASMMADGRDPMALLEDSMEWIHQAQMARVSPAYIAHLRLPEAEAQRLAELSKTASPGAFQGCAHYLLEASTTARAMPSPTLAVEMALVRAASKFATLASKAA